MAAVSGGRARAGRPNDMAEIDGDVKRLEVPMDMRDLLPYLTDRRYRSSGRYPCTQNTPIAEGACPNRRRNSAMLSGSRSRSSSEYSAASEYIDRECQFNKMMKIWIMITIVNIFFVTANPNIC